MGDEILLKQQRLKGFSSKELRYLVCNETQPLAAAENGVHANAQAGSLEPSSSPFSPTVSGSPVGFSGKHTNANTRSGQGASSSTLTEAAATTAATNTSLRRLDEVEGPFENSVSELDLEFLDEVLDSGKLLRDTNPKPLPVLLCGEHAAAFNPSRQDNVKLASKETGAKLHVKDEVKSILHEYPGFDSGRKRVCVLSLDGGGMRGLIVARILAHLESLLQSKTGEEVKICEYFDFLAGTSTGAILTMMLITPDEAGKPLFTAQNCCQFYSRNGRKIFQPRWYDPFKGRMRQFYRPKYSSRRFEKLLKSYLIRNGKALTMRDTLKPFLVTSFDISQATPHIFVRQSAMKDDNMNFRLWEVCRGTAAAPTYFKPAEVTSLDGKSSAVLIDGAAIQNNPTLVAATHVLGNNEEFPGASGLSDLLILSIGAGQLDEKHDFSIARKWGMTGWARPLLNIMMDGSSDTIDYQLASAFAGYSCSENYLRIQGYPKKTALMDCTTKQNVRDLIQCADDLLQEKAVMRNAYGEKVKLEVTYGERLSWFADQLIVQKRYRDSRNCGPEYGKKNASDSSLLLNPTSRLVSPMINYLFFHQQTSDTNLPKAVQKAKSLRY